jgi:hypothetical protein
MEEEKWLHLVNFLVHLTMTQYIFLDRLTALAQTKITISMKRKQIGD